MTPGRSNQTNDNAVDICYFSAKHAQLRRKEKDLLARNQVDVSECSDMSTCRIMFQWSSTIKIQYSVMVEYKADIIIISLNLTYSRHDPAEILLLLRLWTTTHSNNYNLNQKKIQ